MNIKLKRVNDKPEPYDGYRILVDRLWPHAISRQDANISLWLKEIPPSTALRRWYGHTLVRWQEFRQRYREELEDKAEELANIREAVKEERRITLLYSARDTAHNQAVVLREYLEKRY